MSEEKKEEEPAIEEEEEKMPPVEVEKEKVAEPEEMESEPEQSESSPSSEAAYDKASSESVVRRGRKKKTARKRGRPRKNQVQLHSCSKLKMKKIPFQFGLFERPRLPNKNPFRNQKRRNRCSTQLSSKESGANWEIVKS